MVWTLPLKALAMLDTALLYLTEMQYVQVATLRSVVGSFVSAFFLRRSLLAVLNNVFVVFKRRPGGEWVQMCGPLKRELVCARRLLPLARARMDRGVAPLVVAQDAEGESEVSLGGWGLGACFPPEAGLWRWQLNTCHEAFPEPMNASPRCPARLLLPRGPVTLSSPAAGPMGQFGGSIF